MLHFEIKLSNHPKNSFLTLQVFTHPKSSSGQTKCHNLKMSANPKADMKPGKAFVLIMLGWAVVGTSIVLSNQDSPENLDQTARIFLMWPIFLFIAPPGWAILAYVSQKLNENYSVESTANVETMRPQLSIFEATQEASPEIPDDFDQYAENNLEIFGEDSDALEDEEEVIWTIESQKFVAESFNWKCQRCFQRISSEDWLFNSSSLQRLVTEHIIPISDGGLNKLSNLRPVHAKCLQMNINLPPVTRNDWKWHDEVLNRTSSQTFSIPSPKPAIRSYRSSTSGSRSTSSSSRTKSVSERLGDWRRPDSVISQLSRQLERAKISDTQRERAREFIETHHENELLKTCQRGHAMSLENTYFSPPKDGFIQRQCRQCRRDAR